MVKPSPRVLDAIGLVVRWGLAAVWLVSGAIKVSDLNQTFLAVQAYDLLPAGLVSGIAAAVPFLELALGVLLLVGLGTRLTAVVSVLVLLGFIGAVGQAWARGLSIDCGCFGGGGAVAPGETQYPQEIARDLGFLVLAAWLAVRPASLLSLDRRLTGHATPAGGVDETDEPVADDSALAEK